MLVVQGYGSGCKQRSPERAVRRGHSCNLGKRRSTAARLDYSSRGNALGSRKLKCFRKRICEQAFGACSSLRLLDHVLGPVRLLPKGPKARRPTARAGMLSSAGRGHAAAGRLRTCSEPDAVVGARWTWVEGAQLKPATSLAHEWGHSPAAQGGTYVNRTYLINSRSAFSSRRQFPLGPWPFHARDVPRRKWRAGQVP